MEVYPEARPLIDIGASADHRADHRTDLRGEGGDGEFEAALKARYERLSLLTLDLAEQAGEAARDISNSDGNKTSRRFDRPVAAMTKAIWAHTVIERLRGGECPKIAMPTMLAGPAGLVRSNRQSNDLSDEAVPDLSRGLFPIPANRPCQEEKVQRANNRGNTNGAKGNPQSGLFVHGGRIDQNITQIPNIGGAKAERDQVQNEKEDCRRQSSDRNGREGLRQGKTGPQIKTDQNMHGDEKQQRHGRAIGPQCREEKRDHDKQCQGRDQAIGPGIFKGHFVNDLAADKYAKGIGRSIDDTECEIDIGNWIVGMGAAEKIHNPP